MDRHAGLDEQRFDGVNRNDGSQGCARFHETTYSVDCRSDSAEETPRHEDRQRDQQCGEHDPAPRARHVHELIELFRRRESVERGLTEDALAAHDVSFPRFEQALEDSLEAVAREVDCVENFGVQFVLVTF